MNPAAEALTGYNHKEIAGRHFTMLHPEQEHGPMQQEFQKEFEQKGALHGFHLLRKDGRILPVEISTSVPFESHGKLLTIGVFRDITEIKEHEHLLFTQNWALSAYASAALALGRARTSESLLQAICKAIAQDSIYLLAWVGMADDGPEKRIQILAAAGKARSYLDGAPLNWYEDDPSGHGPTATCIRTGTMQLMQDYQSSALLPEWLERAKDIGIRSSVCIPISIQAGWRGALIIYSSHSSAFTPAAIQVFQNLAEQIGHGVHALDREKRLAEEHRRLAKAEKQLIEALSAMVAPIITAMEVRDPYTAGHQSRTADIACAIASAMGWPEDRLRGLRVAAQVHDIGKISIPAEFLTKPTTLTAAEQDLVNGHPETGFTILKDIKFPWPIAETVRQHHERMDGSGYPLGLKGNNILPEARVLAVADVVEAMSSFRSYRPARPMEAVLKEIEQMAGALLDPEVVRVCVALFREKNFVLPRLVLR
jgi:PAS domain S-box-containing protein